MGMYLNNRLKKLERITTKGNLLPIFIEILDDGMAEIYSSENGEKKLMSEAEYEIWSKRFLKSNETALIEVAFIDDISSNGE